MAKGMVFDEGEHFLPKKKTTFYIFLSNILGSFSLSLSLSLSLVTLKCMQ